MSDLLLVSLIGAAGTVVVAILTSLVTLRIAARNATVSKQDVKLRRIIQLEGRVDALEGRDRIHQDYITKLRQHIIDGNPPPPPVWPTYP